MGISLVGFLIFVSYSASSVRTSLTSQSSHLNNAFFNYVPASLFPFHYQGIFFEQETSVYNLFCGPFFIHEHVVVEHLLTPQAQHSAISPSQSSKTSTRRPERGNAIKQTELAKDERQHVVEHFIHNSVFSK